VSYAPDSILAIIILSLELCSSVTMALDEGGVISIKGVMLKQ
jgi:hypothetical protein